MARVADRARRRAGAAVVSRSLQERYSRAIQAVVREAHQQALDELAPILRRYERRDANQEVGRALGLVELRFAEIFDERRLDGMIRKIGQIVVQKNKLTLQTVIPISLRDQGITGPMLDAFVETNVNLIKTIAQRDFARVEALVKQNFETGYRFEELTKQIQAEFGASKFNATRIARDQTNKLNGQVTRERQLAVGITEFIWTTVRDERVREEHEALDGQRFRWDQPPEEGIPGEPIQCRCFAYPVV